jgi:D-alanyl-D-alanine carboxypeptidase (penicillin-binding protein 5/6)
VVTSSALLTVLLVAATPTIARSTTTTTTTSTTTPGATTTTIPGTTTSTTPGATSTTTTTVVTRITRLRWPKEGSAAVAIPQLGVATASPTQEAQPIASLTKMMTAWVVLHQLPLSLSERGPCLIVSAAQYEAWQYDVASGQSNVAIASGETLCEGQLLRGLFVHSAGDYAQLLVTLSGMSEGTFVSRMNADARALGLKHTRYVDVTGIAPGDRSTAQDQATLVVDLMAAEPVVQSIARLTSVWLPVAGLVGSYTPFIGDFGVVGVKSGYTNQAGGCDVMAVQVSVGGQSVTTYAVVLGQHGGDPLALAGQAALVLSRSLVPSIGDVTTPSGRSLAWIGSPSDVATTTTTSTTTTTTVTTTTTSTTTTTVPATTTTTGI